MVSADGPFDDLPDEIVSRIVAVEATDHFAIYRDLAHAIVEYRGTFTYDGLPDWRGQSAEYQEAIRAIYTEAGLDDPVSVELAKIRLHVGNVVREVAPYDHLLALGLSPKKPLRDSDEKRARAPSYPQSDRPVPPVSVQDPMLLARLALDAVRILTQIPVRGFEERFELDGVLYEIHEACLDYVDVSLESIPDLE